MKAILKGVFSLAFVCLAALGLHAQGTLVTNGVTYSGLNGNNEIDVVHNPAAAPAGGSTTGFFLDPNGSTPPGLLPPNTFQFDPIVDVSVRVFEVSAGDAISSQPILAG